jgi:hypothetical protein
MSEEIDVYLETSMKNWAAEYPPPKRGRERLIQAILASENEEEYTFSPLALFGISFLVPVGATISENLGLNRSGNHYGAGGISPFQALTVFRQMS